MNVASEVRTAVEAIERATREVGKDDSGIDERQIKQLRIAIDELETVLNEKKRTLVAARAE